MARMRRRSRFRVQTQLCGLRASMGFSRPVHLEGCGAAVSMEAIPSGLATGTVSAPRGGSSLGAGMARMPTGPFAEEVGRAADSPQERHLAQLQGNMLSLTGTYRDECGARRTICGAVWLMWEDIEMCRRGMGKAWDRSPSLCRGHQVASCWSHLGGACVST